MSELGRLDAVAQAELVRSGEATPLELVDAAIARIEKVDPAAQRRRVARLRARPRRGARDGEGREGIEAPVPRRAVPDEGHRRPGGRRAVSHGHEVPEARELDRARVVVLHRAAARGRLHLARPHRDAGTGAAADHRIRGDGADAQSLESRSQLGRIERRRVVGRRVGHGARSARERRRRLDPHSRLARGPRRAQADARSLLVRSRRGRALGRLLVRVRRLAQRARYRRRSSTSVAGMEPGDPYTAPPPRRPFAQEVGADPGRAADRRALRFAARRRARRSGVAARRRASRRARSKGSATTSRNRRRRPTPTPTADAPTSPASRATSRARSTRWARSSAARSSPDDVEPMTWAIAEIGRATSVAAYLAQIEFVHRFGRRMASWWQGGFDLLPHADRRRAAAAHRRVRGLEGSSAETVPARRAVRRLHLPDQPVGPARDLGAACTGARRACRSVRCWSRRSAARTCCCRSRRSSKSAVPWRDRMPGIHAS